MSDSFEKLIKEAIKVRELAYAPYIDFKVGAALLCKNGHIYTGCNIESNVMTPNVCAERLAIFEAIKNNDKDFAAIAVVGGRSTDKNLDFCFPCGICRQVMVEFCNKDFIIIVAKVDENKNIIGYKTYTLEELLPMSFNIC